MSKVDKITELAQLFKARDNPSSYEITTAKVISISPIVFKISDKIFLSKEYGNLVMSASMFKSTRKIKIENITSSPTITSIEGELSYTEDAFKENDEILVIPISNGEMWYAIDKVRRL